MPQSIDLRSPSSSPISLAFSDDDQDQPLAAIASGSVASGSRNRNRNRNRNRQLEPEAERNDIGRRRPRTMNLHDGPNDGRGLREILDQTRNRQIHPSPLPRPPAPAPASTRVRRRLPSHSPDPWDVDDDDDVDDLSEWGENDMDMDMDLITDEDDDNGDDNGNNDNNSEIGSEDEFVITGANVAPNRFIPPPPPLQAQAQPIINNPNRPLRHNRANVGGPNDHHLERAIQEVDRAVAAQRQNPNLQRFQEFNAGGRPDVNRFREAMDEIDRAVAQRGREHDAIMENDLRRRILSPPAQEEPAGPARRAPIGLGGAVLRAGNRHVNFAPIPPPVPGAAAAAGARARAVNIREPAAVAAYRERIMNQFNLMGGDGGFDFGLGLGRWGLGGGVGAGGEGLGALYADILGRGAGAGGAGPAGYGGLRREEDIQKLISSIPTPIYSKPRTGYTSNFEIEEEPSNDPIVIDDEGMVVLNSNSSSIPKKKPYLICINCQEPLLVSGAYRDSSDRVWALKCGHLLDQKCLNKLSTPTTEKELATVDKHPPLLDVDVNELEPPPKKKSKARKSKSKTKKEEVKEKKPDEYEWKCPVEGCHRKHQSVDVGGVWVNKDGQGAIAVYA